MVSRLAPNHVKIDYLCGTYCLLGKRWLSIIIGTIFSPWIFRLGVTGWELYGDYCPEWEPLQVLFTLVRFGSVYTWFFFRIFEYSCSPHTHRVLKWWLKKKEKRKILRKVFCNVPTVLCCTSMARGFIAEFLQLFFFYPSSFFRVVTELYTSTHLPRNLEVSISPPGYSQRFSDAIDSLPRELRR